MLIVNNAEGGTNGTTVTTGNSGGSSGSAWDTVAITGAATVTYSNTQTAHGSYSYNITAPATATSGFMQWSSKITATSTTMYARAYFYFPGSLPTMARFLEFTDSSVALQGGMGISAAGKFALKDSTGGAGVATSSMSVPLNQWFRVELMIVSDASAGQIVAKIYSNPDSTTPDETVTATGLNTRGGNVGVMVLGNMTSSTNVNMYIDDIAVQDTGYVGPAATTILRNTAEGQTSGTALTTGNSGGGSGTAFDSVANSGGATVAYSNAQAWRGSQSYAITAGSSATTTMLFNSAGDMNGSLQAFFYFPSYPSASTSLLAAYVGGAIGSAFISSTGALVIDNAAGGAIYTSSAGTIPLNTWVRIDLCVTVGTTTSNGRVQAAVSNGTGGRPIASYDSGNTVNTGTTAFTSYRFGKQNTTPSIATFYMDDIAAESSVQHYIDPIVTSIAFVQGNAGNTTTTGATSFPVSFSSNVTAGNLIVVALCFQSSTATGSITDSQGNTYTAAVGPTSNTLAGLAFQDYIFYTVASTSGSNTVTAHISTSSTYIRLLLHEYSGVNTLDATSANTGSTGTPNSGSATTRFTNELVFGWGMTSTGTTAADTGFTLRETAFAESTEDKMVFSSGSYNVTYPADGTPWIAQMATFYALPGATTAWLKA